VALAVLCAAQFLVVLDITVVNVALPAIREDLAIAPGRLHWAITAYAVAFGGLLLVAGRLADLVGRRRVFLAGVALFGGFSLAAAATPAPRGPSTWTGRASTPPAPATSAPRRRRSDARIGVAWSDPRTIRVTMDEPALDWVTTLRTTPLLGAINALSGRLPARTWRPRRLLALHELVARRLLGLGRLRLRARLPAGQTATLMSETIRLVDGSRAVLEGRALGRVVRPRQNPAIGGVAFPQAFATGGGAMTVLDPADRERLRAELLG
jgi:MFS family permease